LQRIRSRGCTGFRSSPRSGRGRGPLAGLRVVAAQVSTPRIQPRHLGRGWVVDPIAFPAGWRTECPRMPDSGLGADGVDAVCPRPWHLPSAGACRSPPRAPVGGPFWGWRSCGCGRDLSCLTPGSSRDRPLRWAASSGGCSSPTGWCSPPRGLLGVGRTRREQARARSNPADVHLARSSGLICTCPGQPPALLTSWSGPGRGPPPARWTAAARRRGAGQLLLRWPR
jgi:hypothetical protein